jgi:adenosylmethionine-8-amino-7-oxononanoate aminotransferase
VISRQQGYHGVTLQAMSATGMPAYWKMFEPRVPGFVHIQTCYPYRFQGARPGETVGQAAARELEEAIVKEGPDTVAAFIAEPIHGGGGVLYPTDDYFPLVRKVCDKHQVLFIADEVITGFCRTGHWFAMTHWNVLPDIMSFAKGVSSGYLPLGGIMVSKGVKEAMDSVKPEDKWMHAFTYSGHPTCCAVGLKNVEIMEREKLAERSATLGTRLHKALHAAFDSHPNVGDIRSGKGLLAAIELVEDKATKKSYGADQKIGARILQEMSKRGVITRARMEHVFFSPALVITEAELDRMVSVTQEAIKAVTGK